MRGRSSWSSVDATPRRPMRLILVRHGQTGSNLTRGLDTARTGRCVHRPWAASAAALPSPWRPSASARCSPPTCCAGPSRAPSLSPTPADWAWSPHARLREVPQGRSRCATTRRRRRLHQTFLAWSEGRTELRDGGWAMAQEMLDGFQAGWRRRPYAVRDTSAPDLDRGDGQVAVVLAAER